MISEGIVAALIGFLGAIIGAAIGLFGAIWIVSAGSSDKKASPNRIRSCGLIGLFSIIFALVGLVLGILFAPSIIRILNNSTSERNYSMNVPANQGWYDTGIQVTSGQSMTLAVSGEAQTAPNADASGPDGQMTICPDPTNTDVARIDCLMNDQPYGVLIGKVGEGELFRVGSTYMGRVTDSGNLYLAVNDNLTFFDDNSGGYNVRIIIR